MYNDMCLNETGWCQAMIHGEPYLYNNFRFDKSTCYVFGHHSGNCNSNFGNERDSSN